MVISGIGESVVFVHDRPGDAAVRTGGTIARLCADGAAVVVLFGTRVDTEDRVRASLGALGVTDWRMLPDAHADPAPGAGPSVPGSPGDGLGELVGDVLREVWATAVVLATDDARLAEATSRAAYAAGIPVFAHRRVSGAIGQRILAIDVSDQLDRKRSAIAACGVGSDPDAGSDPIINRGTGSDPISASGADPAPDPEAVTRTETYVRLPPPPAVPAPIGIGPRVLTGFLALVLGVAFGVLGTIAHQATIRVGAGPGAVALPIGLVLSLTGITALLAGLRLVVGDRLIVFVSVIGLLGTIFLLSLRSAGGSVLVPESLAGTIWSIGPTLVATVVLAWPRIPARRGTA